MLDEHALEHRRSRSEELVPVVAVDMKRRRSDDTAGTSATAELQGEIMRSKLVAITRVVIINPKITHTGRTLYIAEFLEDSVSWFYEYGRYLQMQRSRFHLRAFHNTAAEYLQRGSTS
jgi:hypothetical protein